MDKVFEKYSTLASAGIPDIPCIRASQFAEDLNEGSDIVKYTKHLLSASKEDYCIIKHIVYSHTHMAVTIEEFQYGTDPNNLYVFFHIF